jgi:hypothetical protein
MNCRALAACAGLEGSEFLSLYSTQYVSVRDYFQLCVTLMSGSALFDYVNDLIVDIHFSGTPERKYALET